MRCGILRALSTHRSRRNRCKYATAKIQSDLAPPARYLRPCNRAAASSNSTASPGSSPGRGSCWAGSQRCLATCIRAPPPAAFSTRAASRGSCAISSLFAPPRSPACTLGGQPRAAARRPVFGSGANRARSCAQRQARACAEHSIIATPRRGYRSCLPHSPTSTPSRAATSFHARSEGSRVCGRCARCARRMRRFAASLRRSRSSPTAPKFPFCS